MVPISKSFRRAGCTICFIVVYILRYIHSALRTAVFETGLPGQFRNGSPIANRFYTYILTPVDESSRVKSTEGREVSPGNNGAGDAKLTIEGLSSVALIRHDSVPLGGSRTQMEIRSPHWTVQTPKEKFWTEGRQGVAMLQQQMGPAGAFGRNSKLRGFSYLSSWTCRRDWARTGCWIRRKEYFLKIWIIFIFSNAG